MAEDWIVKERTRLEIFLAGITQQIGALNKDHLEGEFQGREAAFLEGAKILERQRMEVEESISDLGKIHDNYASY